MYGSEGKSRLVHLLASLKLWWIDIRYSDGIYSSQRLSAETIIMNDE